MSRRFSPGFKGRFRADEVNAWQDAADLVKRNAVPMTSERIPVETPNTILVKNTTGVDQDRFAVLGIAGFLIDPDDGLGQFQQRIGLVGVKPIGRGFEGVGELHTEDSFVVLAEPLKNNKIGKAWASGTCPVQVLIKNTGHRYARLIDDDTVKLETAESGPVVILWKQAGAVDETVWAVIRWGSAAGGSTRYRVKNVHLDHLECKTWDGTDEGSVFINIAKPWLLRGSRTSYDGKTLSAPSSDGQQILASNGGTVETWEITLRYVTDAEIYAETAPAGGTGVTYEGDILQLIDTNRDGRHWAKMNSTPPPLGEGGVSGPNGEPFWNQGYAFLDNPGAELTVVGAVLECGVFAGAGAELDVDAISGARASAPALSGPGAAITATVRAAAKGSGALSGPGADVAETALSAARAGATALSGPGAVVVGWAG